MSSQARGEAHGEMGGRELGGRLGVELARDRGNRGVARGDVPVDAASPRGYARVPVGGIRSRFPTSFVSASRVGRVNNALSMSASWSSAAAVRGFIRGRARPRGPSRPSSDSTSARAASLSSRASVLRALLTSRSEFDRVRRRPPASSRRSGFFRLARVAPTTFARARLAGIVCAPCLPLPWRNSTLWRRR